MNEDELRELLRAADEAPACCPECGVHIPVIDVLRKLVSDQQDQLRVERFRLSKLRNERIDQRKHHPLADVAWDVFNYWREKLSPQAREFNGKRFDAVVARLEHARSPEEGVAMLKRAIDGAVFKPYVTDRGRSRTGKPSERAVELELICRNEANVQRFIQYADEADLLRAQAEERAGSPDAETSKTRPPNAPPKHIFADSVLARYREQMIDPIAWRLHELRGWDVDMIRKFGLGIDRGRVVFPIADADGDVTGLVRYQPNPQLRRGGPKSLADGERNLFPAPESLPGGEVWLVEGEPDCMAMWTMGFQAVAVPGVATWKAGWAHRFERFERVIVCFDCDSEGRKAAEKRARSLATVVPTQVVDIDPRNDAGYDLNGLLMTMGPEGGREFLLGLTSQTSIVVPMPEPKRDPLEAVISELEARDCAPRAVGMGQLIAKCPNHDDRHPSLSVSVGRDGKALIHCHAGCSPEEVLGALGLAWNDVFPSKEAM